jgi:hypothetical protein
MSFGVATAAALLTEFTQVLDASSPAHLLHAFQATFVSVGLITTAAAWIFSQLSTAVKGAVPRDPTVDSVSS